MIRQKLEKQTVVITGAAKGIGLATAKAFIAEGATVVLCDIDTVNGPQKARELGGKAHYFELDVSNRDAFSNIIARIEKKIGAVDILINNAGIMLVGAFDENRESAEKRQVNVNLFGVVNGIHAVLPKMQERRKGTIVNVASLAGQIPTPYAALYSASKFAVSGMTEALRYELKNSGVNLSIVYPSMVATEMILGLKSPPFPSPVHPEQVADAIVKAVKYKKPRVYVPKVGRFLSLLPYVLPDFLVQTLAQRMGLNDIFREVNDLQRQVYRGRINSQSGS